MVPAVAVGACFFLCATAAAAAASRLLWQRLCSPVFLLQAPFCVCLCVYWFVCSFLISKRTRVVLKRITFAPPPHLEDDIA